MNYNEIDSYNDLEHWMHYDHKGDRMQIVCMHCGERYGHHAGWHCMHGDSKFWPVEEPNKSQKTDPNRAFKSMRR